MTESFDSTRTWCSLVAKAQGEEPIGSVSPYDLELAVEVPLPWARAVAVSPTYPEGLRHLPRLADDRGIRLRILAVAPTPEESRPGWTRLFALRRQTALRGSDAKTEYIVPTAELAAVTTALIERPDGDAALEPYRQETTAVRDLLVCTHGSRDACCATFGYPLYDHLRSLRRFAPGGPFQVWRTSHLGGHRFAPTLLDLADGRTWGHLDRDAATTLLQRDDALPDLDRHYRGWSSLDTAPQMVAEREAFRREGWAWTIFAVTAETVIEDATHTVVRLAFTSSDGQRHGVYEMTIVPSGVVVTSLGSCGDPDPRNSEGYRIADLSLTEGAGALAPTAATEAV